MENKFQYGLYRRFSIVMLTFSVLRFVLSVRLQSRWWNKQPEPSTGGKAVRRFLIIAGLALAALAPLALIGCENMASSEEDPLSGGRGED
jgi:uncharacterized membrane protein